jgi:hypothetical protein
MAFEKGIKEVRILYIRWQALVMIKQAVINLAYTIYLHCTYSIRTAL